MTTATHVLPRSAPEPLRLIASPRHTLFVMAVGALNAYRAAIQAAHVRAGVIPSRPHMYFRTMVFEFAFLAIVAFGVWLRGESLQTIFGRRWRSVGQAFHDLGFGLALWLVAIIVVSVLSGHGGPADRSIAYLLPQNSLETLIWIAVSITAGICEEAIYRGYFQRQFAAFTHSAPAGILLSAAAFGAVHLYQGWQRASVIAISAILFGLLAHWQRTVRPGMFAHAWQDAIAPTLIKLVRH